MCLCVYVFTCTCVRVCVLVCVRVCVRVCVYVCVLVRVYTIYMYNTHAILYVGGYDSSSHHGVDLRIGHVVQERPDHQQSFCLWKRVVIGLWISTRQKTRMYNIIIEMPMQGKKYQHVG